MFVPYSSFQFKFRFKHLPKAPQKLDTWNSSDFEEISAIALKNCVFKLDLILTSLFQVYYNFGMFPDGSKTVEDILKKGSKSVPFK